MAGWILQGNRANIGLEVNYADRGRGRITQNTNDDGKFAVPTLRNIELTAPYMHDGRYKTLREVINHYNEGIQDSRNLSWALRDVPFIREDIQFIDDSLIVFLGSNGNQQIFNTMNLSSFPIANLGLTEHEKDALEAFLRTLTDVDFIADPKYSNPF